MNERDELISILRQGANVDWGLDLSDAQLAQFARYAELLTVWNATRMNLTRLTSPRDIAVKHFLDSLVVLKLLNIPNGIRLIDIGTGPGLPGLALKIARPDLDVTLLDSTAKKLTFCRAVIDDLGLTAQRVHGRAEEVGRSTDHHQRYDLVTARAVAPLEKLLPWCAPFVKPGGRIVALKGALAHDEVAAAKPVAKRLKLKIGETLSIALPEAEEETVRHIITAAG